MNKILSIFTLKIQKRFIYLTVIFYTLTIVLIEFSVPTVAQIISSCSLLGMFFYLLIKSELTSPKPKHTKKIKSHSKFKLKRKNNKEEKEQEESEFQKQWEELKEVATK